MKTTVHLTLPFFYALMLCSCGNDKEDYPKGYIGFERGSLEHIYDPNHQEESFTLKIVAVDKVTEDKKIRLSCTSESQAIRVENTSPIIEKGKKSTHVKVTLYPQRVSAAQRVLHFTCIPEGKDTKISEITIRLKKK